MHISRKTKLKRGYSIARSIPNISRMQFRVRNTSEYDDFYIVSKESALIQYERAEEMLMEVKEYLRKSIGIILPSSDNE